MFIEKYEPGKVYYYMGRFAWAKDSTFMRLEGNGTGP